MKKGYKGTWTNEKKIIYGSLLVLSVSVINEGKAKDE